MIYFILLTSCTFSLIMFVLLEVSFNVFFDKLTSKGKKRIRDLAGLFLVTASVSMFIVLVLALIELANKFF